jgi:putative tryptophan/tyrosine transport system substrate-binding protein
MCRAASYATRMLYLLTVALTATPLLLTTWLIPAEAQSSDRVYRLGHLAQSEEAERLSREFTLPELAQLGFAEGRNLHFSGRFGSANALPHLAQELLAEKPDAIIAIGSAATLAARAATDRVPIVLFAVDPVRLGLADSFSRPAGNVTGISNMVLELQEKRLELLLEAVPQARRVAVLLRRTSPTREHGERELRAAAIRAGIEVLFYSADGPSDYQAAFVAMRAARAQALVIGSDPSFFADTALLAKHAQEARLPTSCEWVTMARAGCLLGYGPSMAALRRRMAHFVARILRGASPGELAIEQPTAFELALNLNTARALGLAIPSALLARADEVIE